MLESGVVLSGAVELQPIDVAYFNTSVFFCSGQAILLHVLPRWLVISYVGYECPCSFVVLLIDSWFVACSV